MLLSKRFAVAMGLGAALFSAAPASAQSLSQFGSWGEPPERSRKGPSFLGATPALMKPGAELEQGGGRPSISPRTPQTTSFRNTFSPGTIVIDTAGRRLYYTLSSGSAYVYPIAVGKQGFAWTGVERVSKIVDWPDWIPPAEMRQRKPSLPVRMTGGVRNPLGAKAIYLGNTLYRIHGTNDAKSIGSASSSGCFRMHNEQVVHLAGLVNAGTAVYVMRSLPKSGIVGPPHTVKAPAAPQAPDQAAPQQAAPPAANGDAPPAAQAQPSPPANAVPPPAEPADQEGI
ncbi:L,D-transpeptidase [uncultured Hyphomicrobium sp.]|jgi:lipoprotein-anchoring transpeptidase ErfK/SrfK|uniref:L,D-transpeptidase n=1 Tax=uncultured Hyphomicrobium sp. TaxID=194373 RepID=UPI0025FB7571|nr:L,D-transpeptidase [uncultured Hyphomicrobium sp.]